MMLGYFLVFPCETESPNLHVLFITSLPPQKQVNFRKKIFSVPHARLETGGGLLFQVVQLTAVQPRDEVVKMMAASLWAA
jgi:hypothetical protein